MLHIDLETRSRVDLMTAGVYNYATDPSTEIICMAWAFGNGEIQTWQPGEKFPTQLAKYMKDGVPMYAHNAAFERLMFDFIIAPDHGAPMVPLEQWFCTAYQAQASNVPRSLFNAARCLQVKQQKNLSGRNLIQMLSIPQADGTFNKDPVLVQEMVEYCAQDVRTERDIFERLRALTDTEWQDYHVSEHINDRGVRVDMPLVIAAQAYAKEEEQDIINLVNRLSAGKIKKFRGSGLLDWVKERIEPVQLETLKVYRKGEKKYSLDKYSRHRLLDCEDLDPTVRDVVEGADTASKSSVGKYRALQLRSDPEDHRLRGAFVANGASASGRFSSWGAQVHNFPRFTMPDPEAVRLDLIDNIVAEDIVEYFERPVMGILSGMLRPSLIPAPGCHFIISDWSAIEGRVNPWLSNCKAGEAKLDVYRGSFDPYITSACAIYGQAYDPDMAADRRQIGKVAELALGFGGGAGAFLGMGRNYGLELSRAEADVIKNRWRAVNSWAVAFWKACETAAMRALRQPDKRFDAGRVSYFCVDDVLVGGKTLFCELPSGRLLTYPDCRLELGMAPWGEEVLQITAMRAGWTPKTTETEWPRSSLWGGLLVENITQATAAELLKDALRRCHEAGLPVVLHVHDEIVCEIPNASGNTDYNLALHEIMNTAPAWAEGLPIKADVNVAERFGK